METAVKKRNNLFAKVKWEHEAAENIRQRRPHPAELTERLDKLRETREAFDEVQTEIEMGCDSGAIAPIFNHRVEFEQIYYQVKTVYATILEERRDPGRDDPDVGMPDDFKEAIKSLVETQERFLKAQAAVSTNLGELAAQHRRSQAGLSSVMNVQPVNRGPNTNLRLPVFTIPVFRGERNEWRSFKDLFETGIHNRKDIGSALKLQYLLTYLDGEAKSIVSAFPISDANYEPAWTKLKEHYGKNKYIVYSLVRKFCDQPDVNKAETELPKLVSTSDEIVRQLQALGQEYTSRDPWLIHLLLEKLDEETRSLWAQKVISIENPTFNEFLAFLQDRCDALETFSAFVKQPCETDDDVSKDNASTKEDDTDSSTNTVVACTGGLRDVSNRTSMDSITMLPTAVVRIRGKNGLLHEARVLIDSGSQVSFISQHFAKQLAIPRRNARLVVTGLSQQAAGTTKGVVRLFISSRFSEAVVLTTDAYIFGRLTAPLPRLELREAQLRYLYDSNLADPLFYKPGPIDLILGADVLLSVIRDGQVMDNNNQPMAQNSAFGWIISGRLGGKTDSGNPVISLCTEVDIDQTLRMFCESEEQRTTKSYSSEKHLVAEHFEATNQRSEDDRFVVRLSFYQEKRHIAAVNRSCSSSSQPASQQGRNPDAYSSPQSGGDPAIDHHDTPLAWWLSQVSQGAGRCS